MDPLIYGPVCQDHWGKTITIIFQNKKYSSVCSFAAIEAETSFKLQNVQLTENIIRIAFNVCIFHTL